MEAYDILIIILVIWIAIYTASYGVWTWKDDNKSGAIVIFIMSVCVIILPAVMYYINCFY